MTLSRRDMLTAFGAFAAIGAGPDAAARAQALAGTVREEDLLRFEAKGQVTLLHMADLHAQLRPVYLREPSVNLGVGAAAGLPPHVTDRDLLRTFGIDPGSWRAYALASTGFEALALAFGKLGGADRLATLIKAIRAERGPDRVLLLDGGDALQGSYTALATRGQDMIGALERLGVAATTGHWEFTLGAERIGELFGGRGRQGTARLAFLAGNVADTDFDEPVFEAVRVFEKGGVKIAVVGQAFPYTPVANPRWMIPEWSFGLREKALARRVAAARAAGAELVVLLSHNGFDVDRKLAARIEGIDVVLTAHTHDALPAPVVVGRTLLVASGSHGKFLSRLDLEVRNGRMVGYRYALIPVLADVIRPDPEMAAYVEAVRRPHAAHLAEPLAVTGGLLYRRDTFEGTVDDVILDALLEERDAEIALSPGFRWGTSLLPGATITREDLYNATAITYPAAYRVEMTGRQLRDVLEDVADNVFNPDPYYQQGGDMVRTGGLAFEIHTYRDAGQRIRHLTLARTGAAIEASRTYVVAGWGSVFEGTQGPPIWDLVGRWLQRRRVVEVKPRGNVRSITRAAVAQP